MNGQVNHFEIPVNDFQKAGSFYGDLFGWKVGEIPGMEGQYAMIATGPANDQGMPAEKGYIGGAFQTRAENQDTPSVTITVDDLDATLRAIEGKGGAVVVGKQEIPNMGYYARFRDPDGNVLGLWQAMTRG